MMKICVVTGSRAEYGLLRPIIQELKKYEFIKLQIVVTGMHLTQEFGMTYKDVENDGYIIDKKVEMLVSGDTGTSVSKSIGLGVIGFADAFSDLEPDLILLLGDRYEIFSASIAALNALIPIGHIHGGETGAGTIDNMVRHAITKISMLHFVSTEAYRKRVIQLGENPKNVHYVGAPGLENIMNMELLTKKELEKELDFKLTDKTVLFTYHPLSLQEDIALIEIENILRAFDRIPDLKIIFTKSNADAGGRAINKRIEEYVRENRYKAKLFSSLGTLRYLSALKHVKVVAGNSSSGIIEAASLDTYTLNIGTRQNGRIQSSSVYNSSTESDEVYEKLLQILSKSADEDFTNPYEKENTAGLIVQSCVEYLEKENDMEKVFYDLEGLDEF